ncbi:DUF748 domain-containing protein [Parasutterella sp.]|uniref:DUF748 domain-containing protein n=1 Tax=Parasutterella sp. TaxID=2049037 RepID=UPI00351FBDE1
MGKKLWITTGIIGALAAAYTAGGFLGVPYGVNWALKKYAEPIVGRTITTQEVKFNPFTLQFSVKGLNVQKDGEPPLLSVGYLKTKVLWNSLFKLSPLVQYITVDELNSTVIRTGLDTFNFSDIITRIQEMPSSPEEDKEDKKDDKPLQFSIGNINLTNSSITLDDKFRHKVDKVTDLNFALPLISNFQNDVDVPITPDLRFNFNGEPFAINAESVPFTPGKKTGVNFTVTGLSLENAASFNPIPLNVKVTKGTMDCAFNLDFEKKQGEENAYLRLKGTVKMKDVGLEDEIGKAYQIIGVKEIDANLKEFAFFRQNLDIGEIQLHNPSVVVIRDSDSLNLVQLLTHIVKEQKAQVKQDAKEAKEAKEKSALPADEKKTPNDWSWNIDKVSVRNGTINFTDTSNNFKRSATNVNVTLAPINGKDGTRTSIDASVGAIGGHIQANGGMVITPFSMDLNLQSSGLSIADLTPYISQYSGAHVTQGTFSNKGELKLNLAKAVSFSYTGSADVASLNVTDKQGAPAVSLKNLAVGGISVSGLSPLQISLGSIALTSPNVNVVMNKNGSINLASLGTPSSAPAPAAKADSSAASKPQPKAQVSASSSSSPAINVGKITLTDGRVRYTDNSIEPTFKLNASNLAGSLSNYSTTIKGNATIDVKGLLNGTPMNISGTINPFESKLKLAMKGEVTSLSLPAFSPFSAKFTGHPIEKGLLTYKGTFDINQDKLTSENALVINKLEFGSQVPDAKDALPVGLAVSLLQDRQGQIDLNIPVSGSLDDPEFSVGGIIVKVIVNLISKAVTAPFALIGSMFGGEDMDLNNLQFATGSVRLDEKTIKALNIVAKAMQDRPGIKIQIIGMASEKEDGEGLKEQLLMRDMRYAIYRDTTSATNAKVLTAAQIDKAIKQLYSESTAPNKPKNADIEQMKAFLMKNQRVATADLKQLADRRATAVRNYLIQKEKIAADRLFISTSKTQRGDQVVPGVALGLQD